MPLPHKKNLHTTAEETLLFLECRFSLLLQSLSHSGDEFDEDLIDKTFILTNQKAANKFQQLVVDIPIEHIELAEEIISYAKLKTGKKLNDMIYISLVDHIYTSIVHHCRRNTSVPGM